MTTQRVRGYHHGDLRAALLSEARRLLEERGPPGLALREIARRARVAAPSAYHHFRNLDELAVALAEQGFRELDAALQETPADERGRLAPAAFAYIAWAQANPSLYRLMFGEGFGSAIASSAAIGEWRTRTHDLVVDGLRRRVAARDVPAALLFAWSLVHGLTLLMIDGQARPDDPTMIADVFRLAARGIPLGPPPSSGSGS